jgi:broad specificity phosphatase PhoE
MITIFFTRHSISCRNQYDRMGKPTIKNVNDTTFHDTPLCPDGIEKVIKNRKALLEKMGKIDEIITSPLKRCIETTLLTYQDNKNTSFYPIYVMSLVMEYSNGPDSLGKPISQICSDPSIFSYRHFQALNYQYFMEGYQSDYFSQPIQMNPHSMEWCVLDYRMNRQRSKWFFEFLKTHFRGKRIHVITHSLFIYSILGFMPDNYDTLKVLYNPDTEEITWSRL